MKRDPAHLSKLAGFWEQVREAPSRFLVLDYDGTLAPFRVERMQAYPLEGIVERIEAIRDSGRTELAMLSGRPVHEVLTLMGDLGITVVGSQGIEFRLADGRWFSLLPSRAQLEQIARAERLASEVAPEGDVERKPASIAFHTRGLSPEVAEAAERRVREAWSDGADEHGLVCRPFLGGVELRLVDFDKGTALNALTEDRPPGTLTVYLGDDDTDEDAFRALGSNGIGVKVGNADVPTEAHARLRDATDVRDFLGTWLAATAGEEA